MLNFTPMVLLPTLMRVHLGFPDALVGQVIGSRGIGGLIGFFAVIFMARLDPRATIAIGFLLQAIAGYDLMRMDVNVSAWQLELNGILQGLSSGILVVALTLVSFDGIPREKMPEALALYHLLRNIGASFFISLSVAEVIRHTGINYAFREHQSLQPVSGATLGDRSLGDRLGPEPAAAEQRDNAPIGHDRLHQHVRAVHGRVCGGGPAGCHATAHAQGCVTGSQHIFALSEGDQSGRASSLSPRRMSFGVSASSPSSAPAVAIAAAA
jgi:hypothetical protein